MHHLRFLFLLLLLLSCRPSEPAQKAATEQREGTIRIKGAVVEEAVMGIEQIRQLGEQELGAVQLKKGSGEVYLELDNAKGVLLRDVLLWVDISGQDNKTYSSFFVVCTAADGYRCLYSWNELFNTAVGDQAYLITSYDEDGAEQPAPGVMMVSLEDHINGKRNLRGLATIDILNYSTME